MNSPSSKPKKSYTGRDIQVLKGLKHVRKRPGMYIGGVHKAGLHHLLWEIVDNSIDEAMNGHADHIIVHLQEDGETISVIDNGRGIPVDIHHEYKVPTVELLLTELNSGGKFENKNYEYSGGLHGVGLSVVNALSESLTVQVKSDGKLYEQNYAKGDPVDKLTVIEKGIHGTGTSISFRPDPDIFHGSVTFDPNLIRERINLRSYLHRGLSIEFIDDTTGQSEHFLHEGGLEDYMANHLKERNLTPAHEGYFAIQNNKGMRLEACFCWTETTDSFIRSFANGIPTKNGGSHELGLRAAVSKSMRNYISNQKLAPKGVQVTADDLKEGWICLLSVFVADPQFQGQTKEKLNNPEVQPLVDQTVRTAFEQWLIDNGSIAKAIAERNIMAAKARQASRAASQLVRRQGPTRRLNLPGKLADCSSQNPRKSELFIVEGDSAGGSAKMGRDRKTQAILPLRGKVLNTETASLKKVLGNKELSDIVQALGCGISKDFDIKKLRYDKIILLMDADADGHHISTLLLTFFYRHMPDLIFGGHVYLAQPPLYRIEARKRVFWALDDNEKDTYIATLPENSKVDIQRFKGLGEMMPAVLRETTLDPKQRTLLKVEVTDQLQTDGAIQSLMGRDSSARYNFIMERAHEVDDLDTIG
ncbi:MAG: DNA topoisomerase IV subunit B [Deltaproteobacteria bacterium]|nr:DNA topoisomerase IV subunit B [Deltaproteobacteria bacterium]|tara:strand:+ start:11756 stop:13690 length:1935 start_codon:yes stop_codon:yes gene_type:complete